MDDKYRENGSYDAPGNADCESMPKSVAFSWDFWTLKIVIERANSGEYENENFPALISKKMADFKCSLHFF